MRALLGVAPAIGAMLAFPAQAPFKDMVFVGGEDVLLRNLCAVVLMPYVVLFVFAIGNLAFGRRHGNGFQNLDQDDVALIRFFFGAGLLSIGGFLLGAAKLLYPWITGPIFILVIYVHLLWHPRPLQRFYAWFSAEEVRSSAVATQGTRLFRTAICALMALIVIEKGVYLDLNQNDALQLYFPYLADVRRLHSIWLDPSYPFIFGFFVGRGHGAYLFATNFTDEYFGQMLSVIYFCSVALVVRRATQHVISRTIQGGSSPRGSQVIPDIALLLALTAPLLYIDSGKYHFETGAMLIFVSWATALFVVTNAEESRWLRWALVPVVVALPIAVPQTAALILIVMICTGVAAWPGRQIVARPLLPLALAAVAAGIASLLVNQLHVGLAEINPYHMFVQFVDPELFHRWSSVDLLVYVSNAQGFEYVNSPAEVVKRFASAIAALTSAGSVDIRTWQLSLSTTPLVIALLLGAIALNAGRSIRGAHRKLQPPLLDGGTSRFVIALLLPYIAGSLLVAVSGHGSLRRLMSYLDVMPAFVLCLALVLFSTAYARFVRQSVGRPSEGSPWPVVVICVLAIALAAFNVRTKDVAVTGRMGNAFNALSYAVGQKGLLEAGWDVPLHYSNARRFSLCLTLKRLIGPSGRVLALNSAVNVVPACSLSPFLNRGQLQDTLHYVFIKEFGDVMLGSPEIAYEILRKHGIEYLFVERMNPYFWGPGVSTNFAPESLAKHFDISFASKEFYLLTWRGKGTGPLTRELVDELSELHAVGRKATPYYYRGLDALSALTDRPAQRDNNR